MNIYEIDKEIESILADLPIDEETGEIMDAELFIRLNALSQERNRKVENLVLFIKNKKAYAEALKAEKIAIAKRQQSAEKTVASLEKYVESVLLGEKFATERCEVNFRKTTKCEVNDEGACVDWLMSHDFGSCYKVKTEINRAEVTKLIKRGVEVQGAELVSSVSMSIK